MRVDVLDHGFVELVEMMGDDESPIRSARVSYNGDTRTGADPEADHKLRKYLLRNKHTSPFESVVFTFHVKAPIFVLRQWHRHRTWSYNEVSARYTELDEGFYVPRPEHLGGQSTDNKQGRTEEAVEYAPAIAGHMRDICQKAFSEYQWLLKQGVSRELARSVLPVAAYSRMYATVDLHNLFHFLQLRLHPHAQYEIRVYAEAIVKILGERIPNTVGAWMSASYGFEG